MKHLFKHFIQKPSFFSTKLPKFIPTHSPLSITFKNFSTTPLLQRFAKDEFLGEKPFSPEELENLNAKPFKYSDEEIDKLKQIDPTFEKYPQLTEPIKMLKYGVSLIEDGKPSRGRIVIAEQIPILEKELPKTHTYKAVAYYNIAESLRISEIEGEPLEKEEQYTFEDVQMLMEKAIENWENPSPEEVEHDNIYLELAAAYFSFGEYLLSKGNVDDALMQFSKCEKLRIERLNADKEVENKDEDDEEFVQISEFLLGQTKLNLGKCYIYQKQFTEAVPLFEESLELFKESVGEYDEMYLSALNHLAFAYVKLNNFETAEKLCNEALTITDADTNASVEEAQALQNLAFVYSATNRKKEARVLYEKSLKMFRKCLPKNHPDLGFSYKSFANCLIDLKIDAKKVINELLSIAKNIEEANKGKKVLSFYVF